MTDNQSTPDSDPASKHVTRLRAIGTVVLLLGLVVAGLVYWLSPAPEILPDEMSSALDFKKGATGAASNFGQMGAFSYSFSQKLKDPAIQAAIIAVVTVLVAGGCFFLAELRGHAKGSEGPSD
jgi:hypothetical protein